MTNPIEKLTVLVTRRILLPAGDAQYGLEIGSGLLITPSVVLTALHVVCDLDAGATVPFATDTRALSVAFEKLSDRDSEKKVRVTAQIIWPPPGTPVDSASPDIALIALDDPEGRLAAFRAGLDALGDLRGMTFEPDKSDEADLRARGYPFYASQNYENAIRDLLGPRLAKLSPEQLAKFENKNVRVPQSVRGRGIPRPDVTTRLIQFDLEDRAAAGPDPWRGMSGGPVHTFVNDGGAINILGVVARVPDVADGAPANILVQPLPDERNTGFWDTLKERGFKRQTTKSKLPPPNELLARLHRIDREPHIERFWRGVTPQGSEPPRGYLFVVAASRDDEASQLARRLSEDAVDPARTVSGAVVARALFDRPELTDCVPALLLRGVTGPLDEAYAVILGELADKVGASRAPPLPGESYIEVIEARIEARLASGIVPRFLAFEAEASHLLDANSGDPLPNVRELFQKLIATWDGFATEKMPDGRLRCENPLMVVLSVLVPKPDDAETLPQKLTALFEPTATWQPPPRIAIVHFSTALQPLGHNNLDRWLTAEFADSITLDARKECFSLLSETIDDLVGGAASFRVKQVRASIKAIADGNTKVKETARW